MEPSKKDWKLYREKIAEWQELYMERLIKDYIAYLSGNEPASTKFWEMEKLLESQQKGFLLSLTGEKKIIDLPTMGEIEKFCEQVERSKIYFEYETHYYEFDDDGRYMDDWEVWHNDPFGATLFLDKVFAGCHDLMCLEEYQIVSDIMDRVCELQFSVETATASEDDSEDVFFRWQMQIKKICSPAA